MLSQILFYENFSFSLNHFKPESEFVSVNIVGCRAKGVEMIFIYGKKEIVVLMQIENYLQLEDYFSRPLQYLDY